MKKLFLMILPILAVSYSHAQNTAWPSPTSNSNVGIGTTTANQKLTINGGGIGFDWNSTDKKLYSPADGDLEWVTQNGAAVHGFAVSNNGNRIVYLNTNGNSYLNGGNVGIGTTNPIRQLTIQQGSGASSGILLNGTEYYQNSTSTNGFLMILGVNREQNRQLWLGDNTALGSSSKGFIRVVAGSTLPRLDCVSGDGLAHLPLILGDNDAHVGIGTSNPDKALQVNGTIHATEILVDQTIPTPDYVFDKDYDLTTLKDVKTYIDQNHHLPEIPSAMEQVKNGINLGEMNAKLLKKIEELTLYVIEKDEQLKQQQQTISTQQKQLDKINQALNLK